MGEPRHPKRAVVCERNGVYVVCGPRRAADQEGGSCLPERGLEDVGNDVERGVRERTGLRRLDRWGRHPGLGGGGHLSRGCSRHAPRARLDNHRQQCGPIGGDGDHNCALQRRALGQFTADWEFVSANETSIVLASTNPIPSGGSLSQSVGCSVGLADSTPADGYVEVTASSQPDPDSTPNNGVTTEDDYVALPVPPSADISLAAVRDTFHAEDWTITASNAGPSAATVTITVNCSGVVSRHFTDDWTLVSEDQTSIVFHSTNPIPSGGSLSELVGCSVNSADPTPADGYVEVTASSASDPDSTPNNGDTTEDDYVALPAVG